MGDTGQKGSPFQDMAVLTYTRFVTLGTNLAYSMILVRALSPYSYGVYTQSQMILSFAVTFLGLSLPNCVNFLLPQYTQREMGGKVISQVLFLCLVSGGLGAAAVAVGSRVLAAYFSLPSLVPVLWVGCTIPLWQLLATLYDNTFVVLGRTGMVAARRTAFALGKVLAALLLWGLGWELIPFCLGILGVEMSIGLFSLFSLLRLGGARRLFPLDRPLIRSAFRYAAPLAAALVLGTVSGQLGKLCVSKWLGAQALALYSNMTQELPVAILSTSAAAVGVPLIARYRRENRPRQAASLWNRCSQISFLATSWIVGLLWLFAPEAVAFFYSQQYLAGVPVFRTFVWILLMRPIYFGMLLNGWGKTHQILLCSASGVLLHALLLLPFYRLWGMCGLAAASVLSTAFANALQLLLSRRLLGQNSGRLLPWKTIAGNLAWNGMLALAFWPVRDWLRGFWGISWVTLALCGSLWGGAILLIYRRRIFTWRKWLVHPDD